jgi:hypothetical protein
MKNVVTTDSIVPPTQNEITQLYGTILQQSYFYFNWEYYRKYAV